MFRSICSMVLWVVVARWVYAEVALLHPNALPLIDKTLQVLTIPTHDKWPDIKIESPEQRDSVVAANVGAPSRKVQSSQSLLSFPSLEMLERGELSQLLNEITKNERSVKTKTLSDQRLTKSEFGAVLDTKNNFQLFD